MELSPKQRERLRELADEALDGAYGVAVLRAESGPNVQAERERLSKLGEAWLALSPFTRDQLESAMAGRAMTTVANERTWAGRLSEKERSRALVDLTSDWGGYPLNLGAAVEEVAAAMTLPAHRPEKTPGLRRVCRELWVAWREGCPEPEISRAACEAIGAEVADLYGIAGAEAVRRVTVQLRELDAALELPRRKGGPEE